MTEVQIVCAVCKRVLDSYINEEGARYQHTLWDREHGDGHEAVPVISHGEHIPRCDFCQADVVKPWTVHAAPFTYIGHSTDADWAACDTCADLITKNQWNGVIRRAIDAHERGSGETIPPEVNIALAGLYRELRKRIIGLPTPPHKEN